MNKYKLLLLIIFAVVWFWSGINPPSYSYWLLENVPVFAAIFTFIILERRYVQLSNAAYTCILIYLIFPLITFHYGVTGVPFGFVVGEWFGSPLNLYDKVVHFAFGFLGFYPVQEFIARVSKKEFDSGYYVTFVTLFALSALYEIFEWLAAITVNPILAAQFYGAQGDVFDAQKDMTIATVGALLAMILIFLFRKYKKA